MTNLFQTILKAKNSHIKANISIVKIFVHVIMAFILRGILEGNQIERLSV